MKRAESCRCLGYRYSLRGERWLGPDLLPIDTAVRNTWPFFVVTSLCVASATHAYVIMNPRGEARSRR